MKIKQKLIFRILSLIVFSTIAVSILVGSLVFYFTQSAVKNFIMRNDLVIAKYTMNKIDRILYERYLDIQAIAAQESFGNYLLDHAKGTVDEKTKNKVFKRLRALSIVSGPWDQIFINDRQGNILLTTKQKETGWSVIHESYSITAHQAAMKGEIYYSDAMLSDETGCPIVVFSAPIKDSADPLNPIIGTVVGHFSWMAILQILDEISTNVVLFNHRGDIIADNADYPRADILKNKFRADKVIDNFNHGRSRSLIIPSGQGVFPEETMVSLAVQKGYLFYKGSGWRLVSSQPTRVAFAPANKSAGQIVLVLLLFFVSISGVILFAAQKMVIQPITTLTNTIQDISSGDLDKRVAVTSEDEIGQLARSFNEMTVKLQESQEGLEEKIKQRTSELQASQEYNRLILESAGEGIFGLNLKGEHTFINQAAAKHLGYEAKELVGKKSHAIWHSKRPDGSPYPAEECPLYETLHKGIVHNDEEYFWRKDGVGFPVAYYSIPIQQNGKIVGAVVSFTDITERKRNENELRLTVENLRSAHEELKQKQGQLIQSEKLASIGQLAAGVAHEINNPVGFISNNMEILQQYIADYTKILAMVENLKGSIEQEDFQKAKLIVEEIKKFEQEINLDYIKKDINSLQEHNQRGIERIQKIVLDLRIFAREDNDLMDFIRVEEVVDSILSIVHSELKYKAELKKSYGQTTAIKCSAQRLGQVFINIFVNAAQAIEEKGVIEVKTYNQGKYVCVEISDTGKGIEEKNLKKIFDPFFTTKPTGQGTGLGLSVSHEIVKKHGGEMHVKSTLGIGTTFTVMLPIS